MVERLVFVKVNDLAVDQQSLEGVHFELGKNGVVLVKDQVGNVNLAGSLLAELLPQLEKPVLDVLLHAFRKLFLRAEDLLVGNLLQLLGRSSGKQA